MEPAQKAMAENAGHLIALHAAVEALLSSHPNKAALAAAWKEAELIAISSTEDLAFQMGAPGGALQRAFSDVMATLRGAMADPADAAH